MIPFVENLTIYIGITFRMDLTNNDVDGDPVDITGWTPFMKATMKSCTKEIDFAPTITDATGGVVSIDLTDEVTALYTAGEYAYELHYEDDTGQKLGLYGRGNLTVTDTIQ